MKLSEHKSLVSETGKARLRLIFREMEPYGEDFHKLIWEELFEGEWNEKIKLDKEDLSEILGDDAWVADVHSFREEEGIAVLRLGTHGPTDSEGTVWQLYTWREWDLIRNREHRFIMVCDYPFEEFRDDRAEKYRVWWNSKRKAAKQGSVYNADKPRT
ncbi:hypothetical protein [Rubellicoccus peritrichatus]|uniref:Uncharacterized protein n=1 Tax=Rubellicoccus peritrichatus TaxID=3080537 RepID=A0AAQ3QTE1_9BACT|nr:hypothetical protein [Puniceicoccus sp. CR14]WOO39273.1 hypothetical protein RZN69_11675 [Puniceicoccus sp. CR14]